ncbi:MAG: ArnT family glycosyltransferase [Anaerolineae bacterium]
MSRAVGRLAALALLWIMFARMLHAATLLSPVVDEQSHIARGLAVLRTGDLRLRIGHPIGLNSWEALPLALDPAVQLPLDHESWASAAWDRFGEQFLWRVNANPDGIVFRSRVMIMLLALVFGAIVFRWASEIYGSPAGVLALALVSLDPNLVAHGMLATTDLGVTLFIFAATYALWRAMRSTGRRWFIAAGALAGLALVSKYSALFLVPIFATLLLLHIRAGRAFGVEPLRSAPVILHPRGAALILFFASLVVLATYLSRIDLYLGEFVYLLSETQTHASFLLGQRSIEGWWYYFLVTFFFKTPLPTLLLMGIAVALSVRHRSWKDEIFLLVPSVLYFLFSVASGFNVGYRHLLPVVPFLLVYASKVAHAPHPSTVARHLSPAGLSALVLWLALSSFTAHPDYLAYFNEAAPSPRYNVLVDSNLDWGQSLKQLSAHLRANSIDRVKLSYFGAADPAAYGIDFDPLPRWPPTRSDFVPANPAPGVYAISASNLQGVLLDDPSAFDWFRRRRPDAIVGQSILVYHVAADPNPPQAVGLCRDPWTPIDDEKVDALFDRQRLRVVRFDCGNAWWWPSASAWYVVPPGVDVESRSFGIVEYERRRTDDSLVYRVLRGQAQAGLGAPLDAPAQFDGGLTLLGFNGPGERKVGRMLEIESVWHVDAPPSPPVSIFAHLLDPGGVFVVGADGFGVPAELLRLGDLIAQRHRFEIPPDAPEGEYTIEFGFYRLDTLERYSIIVDGKPVDQRVLTGPFSVTQ